MTRFQRIALEATGPGSILLFVFVFLKFGTA